MPHLTYEEYNEYGFTELEKAEFDRLANRASDVLDHVTRNFYVFNSLDDDIEFRRTKFKKAVACQVEYFHEMGATTTHGLKEAGTVTIGRTTVTQGGRNSDSNAGEDSLVSDDVYLYLNGTGLLYRGIGVV